MLAYIFMVRANHPQVDVATYTDADDVVILESIENMEGNNSIDNEAQVSATEKLAYIVKVRVNFPQVDATENADVANDVLDENDDSKCSAVTSCLAKSCDHRKVVSHVFGRNKTCTREMPRNLWIFWCRKHYQRMKYRAEKDTGNWHIRQLGLVRKQLKIFDDWGLVRFWTITLRKAEQDTIDFEDHRPGTLKTKNSALCWERCLMQFLGPNQTSDDVREVLDFIEAKFNEPAYRRRDKKHRHFPGIEFLPIVGKPHRVRRRAGRKVEAEATYKKITTDQSVFNRKTRHNRQFIKERTAKKKAERAMTLNVTHATMFGKENTPDTINLSDGALSEKRELSTTEDDAPSAKVTKRKAVAPARKNAIAHPRGTRPTKRRRLMRGFELQGTSKGETISMEQKSFSDGDDLRVMRTYEHHSYSDGEDRPVRSYQHYGFSNSHKTSRMPVYKPHLFSNGQRTSHIPGSQHHVSSKSQPTSAMTSYQQHVSSNSQPTSPIPSYQQPVSSIREDTAPVKKPLSPEEGVAALVRGYKKHGLTNGEFTLAMLGYGPHAPSPREHPIPIRSYEKHVVSDGEHPPPMRGYEKHAPSPREHLPPMRGYEKHPVSDGEHPTPMRGYEKHPVSDGEGAPGLRGYEQHAVSDVEETARLENRKPRDDEATTPMHGYEKHKSRGEEPTLKLRVKEGNEEGEKRCLNQ